MISSSVKFKFKIPHFKLGKWRVPSNDANISLYLPRRPPCILLSRPPHTHLDAQIERSRGQMKNANETPGWSQARYGMRPKS